MKLRSYLAGLVQAIASLPDETDQRGSRIASKRHGQSSGRYRSTVPSTLKEVDE